MKKLLAFALILAFSVSILAGCGGSDKDSSSAPDEVNSVEQDELQIEGEFSNAQDELRIEGEFSKELYDYLSVNFTDAPITRVIVEESDDPGMYHLKITISSTKDEDLDTLDEIVMKFVDETRHPVRDYNIINDITVSYSIISWDDDIDLDEVMDLDEINLDEAIN